MKVLLLNQAFYPDVVSTAQHATDLARQLAASGHEVTVIASARGYDNPEARFPRRETWQGINILRVPCSGWGKKSKWRRALDFASFLAGALFRLLLQPRYDVVVAMTSPPLISFLAALFVQLRGGRFVFWVMDLNPDEAIAAGWLRPQSGTARALGAVLRHSLRRAERVVVLDRFMQQRIVDKDAPAQKIAVIPPWSHDDAIRYDHAGRLAFRARHGLSDQYVVMYSGNHSPCHPLDTLLHAAERLAGRSDIAFCFIGGGSEFRKVQAFARTRRLANILCLPYQPLDALAASLSAADLHVVVMGDPFVGIVHPCKIYNILAIGKPFLYIGAAESHVTDILSHGPAGDGAGVAAHGDTDAVVNHILAGARRAAVRPPASAPEISLAAQFSKQTLLPRMIQVLESVCAPSHDLSAGPAHPVRPVRELPGRPKYLPRS